ncbi:MAG: N-acetyltransferase [Firmicutes bacterium]|nr:N-acetyltransferase [Bacillota bacterium]
MANAATAIAHQERKDVAAPRESNVTVKPAVTGRDRREFIRVPWLIYRGDPFWVPPLLQDMRDTLNIKKNPLLKLGPHAFFLAYRDGKIAGRIGVGIDEKLNAAKKRKEGYFTLFESVADYAVARALFDAGLNWLREKGMASVTGPASPTNGDDYRGLLISGFGSPPVLMDSYNPKYYVDFLDRYGFEKSFDRFAYWFDLRPPVPERMILGVNYAMQRYQFTVDPIDLKKLDSEMVGIKEIIDRTMPEDWPDMIPPSLEEIRAEAQRLLQVAEPDLIQIARTLDGKPIGFSIALPDYNQVLARLNGRLFPFGIFKLLWLKRTITGARSFIMFVVPEFQKKGVSGAIYLKTFQAARKMGYVYGEGSTIGEFNLRMRRDAEGASGQHYKTYRVYAKKL